MELIIRIGQLLLSLTLLVILHEMGHFFTARYFKTRVEKFYLFFNPWFSLFKVKKGDTTYGIGWLPLGGYVKIAGMIDESMDKEQMKKPPKPDEFRSKPAWQRLIIILGGVIVNIVLAYFIYVGISYKWGETYLPNDSLKYGVTVDSMTYDLGLRNGDKILKVDDKAPDDFNAILVNIIMNNSRSMTVLRNSDTVKISIPESFQKNILTESSKSFKVPTRLEPRLKFSPFVIAQTMDKSVAQNAGLEAGDKIINVDGIEFDFYDEFKDYLKKHTNTTITVSVLRNNTQKEIIVPMGDKPLLGVYMDMQNRESLALKRHTYSFGESFAAGWDMFAKTIDRQLGSFKIMFTKEGASSLGGIGTMTQIFPSSWSWYGFWHITAMLSIMFAFLNVLPIPGLDGGHAMFITYELITGRKPNQRFMEIVQTIGILFLISLMIFVNFNDVLRFMG
ncbi:regulator of sigma E protease [Balneicella halophila]|uniref:Zinc metalloprotease n=1 Tax=Balneicella halophila TaxID=1537566 RepID=A0A7L4UN75_BALHA|nr:RIP metalloprotease RseP [Balneicella halophila]PVX50081.1 regulator of sigma E protease [Balneicella halophila]